MQDLIAAISEVLERFEREYQDLTDGQFGSIEDFPEVKRLRSLIELYKR
jgi:hypothetical protein